MKNTPGQYVLLNRVQPSSKNIAKSKKPKNKGKILKKVLENPGINKPTKKQNKAAVQATVAPNVSNKNKKKRKQKPNNERKVNEVTKFQKQNKNVPSKDVNQNKNKQKSAAKKDFHEDLADRLKSSRFRFINEELYTHTGDEAQEIFSQDDTAFTTYHEGYRKQVEQWPLNPLDRIINSVKKLPSHYIVADFGCGEARLSQSVPQKCYSFDLVAANESVIACNMAHTPLSDDTVNVAVFCLSLMGTNLHDFLLEANRVLKIGCHLKIAEIVSRFENVNAFIKNVKSYGFDLFSKDVTTKVFYFLYFKKVANVREARSLPKFSLKPCIYKKR